LIYKVLSLQEKLFESDFSSRKEVREKVLSEMDPECEFRALATQLATVNL
jgi:hypothetical protein